MKYEIPREAFKQRLENRLNFVFVDLSGQGKFENTLTLSYGNSFKTEFASKYPNKTQNIVLFSLKKGDEAPAAAATDLAEAGYKFVYFYKGTPEDSILDKGLN
jgi:hypothetical protein